MKKNTAIDSSVLAIAPNVWGKKDFFVNFYMVQNTETDEWLLIDTGLKWSAGKIKNMAASLFGINNPPAAIVLTHGHFDHSGAVESLAAEWNVPVYAHSLEIPYLTNKSSYPPPDPGVGGGLMSSLSFLYPSNAINIWKNIKPLPEDGTIPGFKEWEYIHTPGHSPGHISLFRSYDKVLIAGDAIVTTTAESAFSVLLQVKKLSGPPKYLTCDWQAAKTSVEKLAALHPLVLASGHGKPMYGNELELALENLSENFYKKALPEKGRYIPYPAITDSKGVVYLPAEKPAENHLLAKGFTVAILLTTSFIWFRRRRRKQIENENYIDVEYNY